MKIFGILGNLFGKYKDKHLARNNASKNRSAERPGRYKQAKLRLASNPDTAPEVLEKLAARESIELLTRVAENPQTESITLERLANHEAAEVRSAVAENRNTPATAIESLAADESVSVRFALAENANSPLEVLEALSSDDNPYVAARAKQTLNRIQTQ